MKTPLAFLSLVLALIFAVACAPNSAPPVPQTAPTTAPQTIPTEVPTATSAPGPTIAPTALPAPTTATLSSSAPAQAPAPGQASRTGNALDIILNAEKAFTSVKSVRMSMVNTLSDGTAHSTTLDYLAPDRVHATVDVNDQTNEFIVVRGQGTWMKENDQWTQSGFDMSSIVFAFLDPQIVDQLAKGISVNAVKYDGTDVTNGTPTWVYEYDVALASPDQSNPLATNGTFKMWIGQNDGRPYRMEGTTEDPTNQGQKIQTVVTYDYTTPIQIEVPQ